MLLTVFLMTAPFQAVAALGEAHYVGTDVSSPKSAELTFSLEQRLASQILQEVETDWQEDALQEAPEDEPLSLVPS